MATKFVIPAEGPNPTFGKIPLGDVPKLLFFLFARLPTTIFLFFLKRPFSKSPRQWGEDLKRLLTRRALASAPLSLLRRPGTIDQHSASKRYQSIKDNLGERVVKPAFAGYWVCKPSFQDTDPADSDVVIIFTHGGGYVTGHPLSYTTFLLRIAETIIAGGKTVSIFSLQYSLAPESVFPTQLSQTAACYEYLVKERQIPAEKIALMGDSAGGSIALSLAVHLQVPHPSIDYAKGLSKPGMGLYLISPWVSIFSQTGKDKEDSDLLPLVALNRWSSFVAGNISRDQVMTYTDFLTPIPERGNWNDIFPMKIWLSAGEDEIFMENILDFSKQLREAHVDVTLSVGKGEAHDWQFGQSLANEKEHLSRELGTKDDGILSGADEIGKAVLEAFDSTTAPRK